MSRQLQHINNILTAYRDERSKITTYLLIGLFGSTYLIGAGLTGKLVALTKVQGPS